MISLLNGSAKKADIDVRALYRQRLLEMAENGQHNDTSQAQSAIEAELSEIVAPEPVRSDMAVPEGLQEGSPEQSESDQFRVLAEQIAPKCIEALAEAMRGMHRFAVNEWEKAEDVIDRLIALSDETRHINGEISSLRETADFLGRAQRELTNTAATLEGKLGACAANDRKFIEDLQTLANAQARDRESQEQAKSAAEEQLRNMGQRLTERLDALEKRVTASAETVSSTSECLEVILRALEKQTEANARMRDSLSHVEEGQLGIEHRLDSQAEALRTLHAFEQGRGSQLQAAIQSIKEMTVGCSTLAPLPEEL